MAIRRCASAELCSPRACPSCFASLPQAISSAGAGRFGASRYVLTADRDEKIRVSHFPQTFNIHGFCLGHKT